LSNRSITGGRNLEPMDAAEYPGTVGRDVDLRRAR
jgi:hypothetical protein